MIAAVKRLVRRTPWLIEPITWYRAIRLEEAIAVEEEYYVDRSRALGLSYSENDSRRRLAERLCGRGLVPKPKGALRILAAYTHYTWENDQWPDPLRRFGEVAFFDWRREGFDDTHRDWGDEGRRRLGEFLVRRVEELHQKSRIDALFGYLSAQIVPAWAVKKISEMGIFTFNVGYNDKLDAFRGSRPLSEPPLGTAGLAAAFDLNVTNARAACTKYLVEGGIPLYLPQGASLAFKAPSLPKTIAVSFVSTNSGCRGMWIRSLRRQGVDVKTFGRGWPGSSVVPLGKMLEIYGRSWINLGHSGMGDSDNLRCLKGRDWEVPMAGGFYMTLYHPDLEEWYEVGREIVCYRDVEDLVDKIDYFLVHPDETEGIAKAGQARARRDHTWERRFEKIFAFAGLLSEADER